MGALTKCRTICRHESDWTVEYLSSHFEVQIELCHIQCWVWWCGSETIVLFYNSDIIMSWFLYNFHACLALTLLHYVWPVSITNSIMVWQRKTILLEECVRRIDIYVLGKFQYSYRLIVNWINIEYPWMYVYVWLWLQFKLFSDYCVKFNGLDLNAHHHRNHENSQARIIDKIVSLLYFLDVTFHVSYKIWMYAFRGWGCWVLIIGYIYEWTAYTWGNS